MLFNHKIVSKLMKDAYKSTGLTVARSANGEVLLLAGEHWKMEMYMDVITNETKGDIIKLIGEIPAPGHWVVEAKKGVSEEKLNMEPDWINKRELEEAAPVQIAGVIINSTRGEDMRLLQDPDTGEILMVHNTWAIITSFSELDYDKEYWPDNPTYNGVKFFWNNMTCRLQAYLRTDDYASQIIEGLKGMEIIWDGTKRTGVPEGEQEEKEEEA